MKIDETREIVAEFDINEAAYAIEMGWPRQWPGCVIVGISFAYVPAAQGKDAGDVTATIEYRTRAEGGRLSKGKEKQEVDSGGIGFYLSHKMCDTLKYKWKNSFERYPSPAKDHMERVVVAHRSEEGVFTKRHGSSFPVHSNVDRIILTTHYTVSTP